MTTQAIVSVVKAFILACNVAPAGTVKGETAVMKSASTMLRERADQIDKCEAATKELLKIQEEKSDAKKE